MRITQSVFIILILASSAANAEWTYRIDKIDTDPSMGGCQGRWKATYYTYVSSHSNKESAFNACHSLANSLKGVDNYYHCRMMDLSPAGGGKMSVISADDLGNPAIPYSVSTYVGDNIAVYDGGGCDSKYYHIEARFCDFGQVAPVNFKLAGWRNDSVFWRCRGIVPRASRKKTCEAAGNQMKPGTGSKTENVNLGLALQNIPLTLSYDSADRHLQSADVVQVRTIRNGGLGNYWSAPHLRRLLVASDSSLSVLSVTADRGDGRFVIFANRGSTRDSDVNDRLMFIGLRGSQAGIAARTTYQYYDSRDSALEEYDSSGNLTKISLAGGGQISYQYSTATDTAVPGPGYLLRMSDQFGRSINFTYDANGQITSLTGPGGRSVSLAFNGSGMLTSITFPDGLKQQFLYEDPAHPWALTSTQDESGVTYLKTSFDGSGNAIETSKAGNVDRHTVSYGTPPVATTSSVENPTTGILSESVTLSIPSGVGVQLPDGSSNALTYSSTVSGPRVTSQTQPAGSGCGPATANSAFDANGNLSQRDDFNGARTCHAYDLSRNLELARFEGLSNTQACNVVTAAGASLPSGTRKTSTFWHPDWRFPVKIAEPKRLTTHVYNGQPDPFAGNAISSCAPATAKLPDGKPIAVLCKTVEQATYDAVGGAGFAAMLDISVPNRVWSYTYNEFGQVLTTRDPRNNITTNTYYASTTADYTRGDLEQTTDALSQQTRFPKYNATGQVLQSIDPNGIVTDYEYDLRQRLKSQTTAGQSTIYTYTLTGLLERVSQPDGSYVGYEYDPAHRLTAVQDNVGNRIEYTLDASGRSREEKVKDPSGTLKRQVSRVFDALGRTQQATGRE